MPTEFARLIYICEEATNFNGTYATLPYVLRCEYAPLLNKLIWRNKFVPEIHRGLTVN